MQRLQFNYSKKEKMFYDKGNENVFVEGYCRISTDKCKHNNIMTNKIEQILCCIYYIFFFSQK